MQDSLSYIILALIGVIIYLLVTQRKNKEEPKNNTEELNSLKESCLLYTSDAADDTLV